MAKKHGRYSKLKIGTDAVGKVTDITFNRNKGEADASDHDSGGDSEFIQSRRDATVDVSGNYDPADTGQLALAANYYADDVTAAFTFQAQGTNAGLPQIVQTGFVTAFNIATPNDGPATFSATIRLTGTATTTAQ